MKNVKVDKHEMKDQGNPLIKILKKRFSYSRTIATLKAILVHA